MSKYKLLMFIAMILTLGGLGLWVWDAFFEDDGEVQYFALFAGLAALFAIISAFSKNSSKK